MKTILIAISVGAIVGLTLGILIYSVPAIDNLIPDTLKTVIIGGIAGAIAAISNQKSNKTKDRP